MYFPFPYSKKMLYLDLQNPNTTLTLLTATKNVYKIIKNIYFTGRGWRRGHGRCCEWGGRLSSDCDEVVLHFTGFGVAHNSGGVPVDIHN
jgi:hypothetical protein